MKHQSQLKPQRAYVTRRSDFDNSLWVQEEAERLALIDGNPEEAKRRRDAAIDLKAKKRRAPEDVYLLPTWLVRDLGGPRDPIAYLVKERALTVNQGRTALMLREHAEGITIDVQGNGEFGVFVQGGQQTGLEGWCDKRKHGVHAWKLALDACEVRARRAVERVICGKAGLKQARRLLGMENNKAHDTLKANLTRALDASTAYLGAQG